MKRWIWIPACLVALGILARLPHPATDIGKLEPVGLVRISIGENGIQIGTDTDAVGIGGDLAAAAKDLHDSTGKEVFLETADYLILPLEGNVTVSELLTLLRPSVRVCLGEGVMDLEAARAYLSVHEPAVTLYGLHAGEQGIETLTMNEGRGALGTQ